MGFKLYEKVLLIASSISLAFRLLNVPWAFSFFSIFSSVLGFSYVLAGWYLFSVKENEVKQNNLAYSIITGFILVQLVWGILFKVASWPGYDIFLYGGLLLTLILFVVTFIIRQKSSLKLFYLVMIKRLAILMVAGILVILLPVKHYSYTKDGIRTQVIQNPDGTKTEVIDTGSIQ